jgi:hypothetical protein
MVAGSLETAGVSDACFQSKHFHEHTQLSLMNTQENGSTAHSDVETQHLYRCIFTPPNIGGLWFQIGYCNLSMRGLTVCGAKLTTLGILI